MAELSFPQPRPEPIEAPDHRIEPLGTLKAPSRPAPGPLPLSGRLLWLLRPSIGHAAHRFTSAPRSNSAPNSSMKKAKIGLKKMS
jgi:hypothetical protein